MASIANPSELPAPGHYYCFSNCEAAIGQEFPVIPGSASKITVVRAPPEIEAQIVMPPPAYGPMPAPVSHEQYQLAVSSGSSSIHAVVTTGATSDLSTIPEASTSASTTPPESSSTGQSPGATTRNHTTQSSTPITSNASAPMNRNIDVEDISPATAETVRPKNVQHRPNNALGIEPATPRDGDKTHPNNSLSVEPEPSRRGDKSHAKKHKRRKTKDPYMWKHQSSSETSYSSSRRPEHGAITTVDPHTKSFSQRIKDRWNRFIGKIYWKTPVQPIHPPIGGTPAVRILGHPPAP
jgi:hypothetical protein